MNFNVFYLIKDQYSATPHNKVLESEQAPNVTANSLPGFHQDPTVKQLAETLADYHKVDVSAIIMQSIIGV